jgi:hypothetical protein
MVFALLAQVISFLLALVALFCGSVKPGSTDGSTKAVSVL